MSEPDRAGPRHYTAAELRETLPMRAAVAAVGRALDAAAERGFDQPPRLILDEGRLLVMAATDRHAGHGVVKTVTVRPDRMDGLPTISGIVHWVDGSTGRVTLSIDGAAVTALRTGAVSGFATDVLSPRDAHRLTIIGAGPQAVSQVAAVCAVRPIDRVVVVSRTEASAQRFVERLRQEYPEMTIRCGGEAAAAVADADIVCCATTSTSSLFEAHDLPDSVHVNAIGAYRPEMRELPTSLLTGVDTVWVDDVSGSLVESGEIIDARDRGLAAARIRPITRAARTEPRNGRTVFKSVGCGVLDWAIAAAIATSGQ